MVYIFKVNVMKSIFKNFLKFKSNKQHYFLKIYSLLWFFYTLIFLTSEYVLIMSKIIINQLFLIDLIPYKQNLTKIQNRQTLPSLTLPLLKNQLTPSYNHQTAKSPHSTATETRMPQKGRILTPPDLAAYLFAGPLSNAVIRTHKPDIVHTWTCDKMKPPKAAACAASVPIRDPCANDDFGVVRFRSKMRDLVIQRIKKKCNSFTIFRLRCGCGCTFGWMLLIVAFHIFVEIGWLLWVSWEIFAWFVGVF